MSKDLEYIAIEGTRNVNGKPETRLQVWRVQPGNKALVKVDAKQFASSIAPRYTLNN